MRSPSIKISPLNGIEPCGPPIASTVASRITKDMMRYSVVPRMRSRSKQKTMFCRPACDEISAHLKFAAFHLVKRPLHLQLAAVVGFEKDGYGRADEFHGHDARRNFVADATGGGIEFDAVGADDDDRCVTGSGCRGGRGPHVAERGAYSDLVGRYLHDRSWKNVV